MVMVPRSLLGGVAALLFLLAAPEVTAQVASPGQSATVFRYADPGQPTLALQIWGDVRAPGLYVIERETDLVRLLSLAGGPHIPGERPRQRTSVTVSISRSDGTSRSEFFSTGLDDLHSGAVTPPALQEGDIVRVDTIIREVFHWRDAAAIVSSAGTLALLILRITDRL